MQRSCQHIAYLILSVLVSFALLGTWEAQAQSPQGRVRLAQLSPDAPAVDIYLDGKATLQNSSFKTVSNYLPVAVGAHKIDWRIAGQPASIAPTLSASVNIANGKYYTVGVIGLPPNLKAQLWEDNNVSAPIGQTKMRFYQASPDVVAVDLAPRGAAVTISNLTFGSASDYLIYPAGSYDLELRAARTATVLLNLRGLDFPANQVVSVFVVNRAANLAIVNNGFNPAPQGGGNVGGVTPQIPVVGAGGLAHKTNLNGGWLGGILVIMATIIIIKTKAKARKNA